MGGLDPKDEGNFIHNIELVTSHFARHTARVFSGMHDTMDSTPPTLPRRRFPYDSTAYAISSNAARKLVHLVATKQFVSPTPMVLVKLLDLVDGCYTLQPLLASPKVIPHMICAPFYDDVALVPVILLKLPTV